MRWTAAELVAFLAKVLYEITHNGLTLDYAFQKVKRRWRRLESFKVFYDAAFDAVRHYYFLQWAAGHLYNSSNATAVAKTWFLLRAEGLLYNRELVARFKKRLSRQAGGRRPPSLEELGGDPVAYLSVKYSYHPAIVRNLLKYLPRGEVERLLEAGNHTWIWLRVNTLKYDIDKAVKLVEREAEVEPHPEIPFALLVRKATRPIQYLTAVRRLAAVPQDISSIYAVLALAPRRGERIVDLAAAPGMKTSLIVQLSEGARVVAVELSRRRAARMRRLLKQLGAIDHVEIVHADSRLLKGRIFDKALLDAPCTSSGAFTKEPAVKIYPRLGDVEKYAETQLELLKNALSISHEVIYAVCSLLPQEGEEVVERSGGKAERPLPALSPPYWGNLGGRTFPHVHRGEAFFISRVTPPDAWRPAI